MENCRICQRPAISAQLDFGPQAIRNRFLRTRGEGEYLHPLAVGCCSWCGAVQLVDPPPIGKLRPRFGWIGYNEPERHLDEVVKTVAGLPGVSPDSVVAGLTYKDDSTLTRLRKRGFHRTWRPEPRRDLAIEAEYSGIESIQEKLTPGGAEALLARSERPHVLIVRHVLEHAQDPTGALEWAGTLVGPEGFVVFEVPDATRALALLDYTAVWEEHVLYFTPATLRSTLERSGFEVLSLESYEYPVENSLVVIARPGHDRKEPAIDASENDRAQRFIQQFPRTRERIERQIRGAGRVALLGAGHLAGAFINLYGLANHIEFVVDDSPYKQGLFMPGSRRPIVPSGELIRRGVDLCLMTVRPEIEQEVVRKNEAFRARGGILASIFPNSPFAFTRLGAAGRVLA